MRNEPVIASTAVATVTAVIAVMVAFNVPLSDAQQASLIGLVVVVAPLVAALWARRHSTPSVKVIEQVDGDRVIAGEASPLPTGEVISDHVARRSL